MADFPDLSPPDWLIDDLIGTPSAQQLESSEIPDARAMRREARHRFRVVQQHDTLAKLIQTPPAPGETIHIISAAEWDHWTCVDLLLTRWMNRADQLYVSTWATNNAAVTALFAACDAGRIGQVKFCTGLYFRRLRTAIYTKLLEGLRERGGHYGAFPNHAKILLINDRENHHVITGSANLTYNPRAEQTDWTNDRDLWTFYRDWFEAQLHAIPADMDLHPKARRAKATTG